MINVNSCNQMRDIRVNVVMTYYIGIVKIVGICDLCYQQNPDDSNYNICEHCGKEYCSDCDEPKSCAYCGCHLG